MILIRMTGAYMHVFMVIFSWERTYVQTYWEPMEKYEKKIKQKKALKHHKKQSSKLKMHFYIIEGWLFLIISKTNYMFWERDEYFHYYHFFTIIINCSLAKSLIHWFQILNTIYDTLLLLYLRFVSINESIWVQNFYSFSR